MTEAEQLLRRYVSNWGSHPDTRPAYYELFDKAIGGDGFPDLMKLRELESQSAGAKVRLVFSAKDVADQISKFYRMFMTDPLKAELEEGRNGRNLMRFFSMEETKSLQTRQTTTEDEKERVLNKAAATVLEWYESITPGRIEPDIRHVLEEHERFGEHMEGRPAFGKPETKLWSCSHESEYVQLDGIRSASEEPSSLVLKPVRGFDAPDHVIDLGWEIVAFPRFLVVANENVP